MMPPMYVDRDVHKTAAMLHSMGCSVGNMNEERSDIFLYSSCGSDIKTGTGETENKEKTTRMDAQQSVRTAVEKYITDAMQQRAAFLLQSGTFNQSMTYVKVTTPTSCGTDSSINASQTVNGVDTLASTLFTNLAYQDATFCHRRGSTQSKWQKALPRMSLRRPTMQPPF